MFFFPALLGAVLFFVSVCYADPHLAVHGVVNHLAGYHSVGKRQAPAVPGSEKIQCMMDKVNEAFGEDSEEASRCKTAADGDFLGSNNNGLQSTINKGFEVFCTPKCGEVILKAYSECGLFDNVSGTTDFLVGLCATNEKGRKCYESYTSALSLLATTEAPCYYSAVFGGECDATSCQAKLQSAAEDQGCCNNVYHDFFAKVASLDFPALYSACKVDAPNNCNSSPLMKDRGSRPIL